MKDLKKGMFITFEGPEGSGKSTAAKKIYEFLKQDYRVILTKEPGNAGDLKDNIRKLLLNPSFNIDPITELFLYNADRSEHYKAIIMKALADKNIVLCDRSFDSTLAYQGYGRGIDKSFINYLRRFATHGLNPDLTIILDVPVEIGFKRLITKEFNQKDRLEREDLEFHKRVRIGYLEIAKEEPQRVKVVDATKPLEEVFSDVKNIIFDRIKNLRI